MILCFSRVALSFLLRILLDQSVQGKLIYTNHRRCHRMAVHKMANDSGLHRSLRLFPMSDTFRFVLFYLSQRIRRHRYFRKDFRQAFSIIDGFKQRDEVPHRDIVSEPQLKAFDSGQTYSRLRWHFLLRHLRGDTILLKPSAKSQYDVSHRLNLIRLGGVSSTDEKVIGKKLQEIAKNATTGGQYLPIGELYGFPIKVVERNFFIERIAVYGQSLCGGGQL